jgi:AraC family transcriptional regulator
MLTRWRARPRYDQVGSAGIVARRTNIRTGMARRYFAAWEEHVGDLITPEELPKWVPGDLTLDSAPLAWDGLRIRGYRYAGSDVPVPALHDYLIVVYKEGATPMHRRCDSGWRSETCEPGNISLMTHATGSHWRWRDPIEVMHLYLSPRAVAEVAAQVFERDIEDVELRDVLKAEDTVFANLSAALTHELKDGGIGGRMYIDALRDQACVHILRNYADVVFRKPKVYGGLSRAQQSIVVQYVEDNIERNISLAELANLVQLSGFHFTRKFHIDFGCPPHAYVIQRRLEHAKRQLARKDVPLKCVAANCGFSDQSHMNRLFRRVLGLTPAAYRGAV